MTTTTTVQFRYIGDEPRNVSILPDGILRALTPDELFDVPAAHWASYACQPALYQALSEDPDRQAVAAVLENVETPDQAREALRIEQMSPNARPKLLAELERRADPDASDAPDPAAAAAPSDVPQPNASDALAEAASDAPSDAPQTQAPDAPATTSRTRRSAGQREG